MFQKILFSMAAFAVVVASYGQQPTTKPVRPKLENLNMKVSDTSGYSQKSIVPVEEEYIFSEAPSEPDCIFYAEQMPEFPGGHKAMLKFLSKNLAYPEAAIKANVQGVLYAGFTITGTGQITEPKILKGIGHGCDEEAIRLIKLMPLWKPGRQNGKPVAVRYTLPIQFALPTTGKKPTKK